MAFSEKIKNILSFLLRFGLSALLLVYLFHKIDFNKIVLTIKDADSSWLIPAGIIFFALNFILLFRWRIIIQALELKVPFISVLNSFFIGLFFNLFLPSSTGGDIVKVLGLFRDTQEKAKVVASVVFDRLSGFIYIATISFFIYLFAGKMINDRSVFVSIMILTTLSILLLLVLFNEKIFSFIFSVFNRYPKVKDSLMRLHWVPPA